MTQTQPPRGHKPSLKATREQQAAKRALADVRQTRNRRRRRLLTVFGPIALILVVVGALVAVKATSGDNGRKSGEQTSAATDAVVAAVTGVPAATLDAVGLGASGPLPKAITASPLNRDGKPLILDIGAEYCPFCAAERWPMIVALSRFGTWHGLSQTASAPAPEVHPNTPTFTFHGATYTSDLVSFTGVELRSNQVVNGEFEPLDELGTDDAAVMAAQNPSGGIPFIDIGGQYVINGATLDVGVLTGKTHKQIADALADPKSPIARGVDGAANVITAAVCSLTANAPATVCNAPGVVTSMQALTNAH
jgi:hypothetical protein